MKITINIYIISGLLFVCGFLSSCTNVDGIRGQEKKENINQVNKIAAKINNDFLVIKDQVQSLANYTLNLYKNQDNYICKDKGKYSISSTGVLYKPQDDFNSAVFVSGLTPITEKIIRTVCFTEPMDSLFKEILRKNKNIVQAYYNDRNNYNRIYPFFDVLSQYEPRLDISSFNFYYLADSIHNPDKKAVWINKPYVDPAGRGWMVSAIAPVYFNSVMEGVCGLDVTVNSITDKYFSDNQNDFILVNNSGAIITVCESIINLIGLPALTDHKYMETIKKDTFKNEDYNLFHNRDPKVRNAFKRILNKFSEFEKVSISGEDFWFFASEIKELNWYLIKIVKK